jgi:hypothetical protein
MQGRRDDLVVWWRSSSRASSSSVRGARESDERRQIWRCVGGRRESYPLAYRRGGRRWSRGAGDVESGRTEEAGRHSGASRGQRVENALSFPQRGGQVAFPIIVALVQLPITCNAWWEK